MKKRLLNNYNLQEVAASMIVSLGRYLFYFYQKNEPFLFFFQDKIHPSKNRSILVYLIPLFHIFIPFCEWNNEIVIHC